MSEPVFNVLFHSYEDLQARIRRFIGEFRESRQ